MRHLVVMLGGAALAAAPAFAADELKFGPVPLWVVEQSIPSEATQATEAPVAQLLNDTQVRLEPGKITSFTELAIKVQSPEGLAAGNITFMWQPATDTVTVNKVHILRDGKHIDVLKAGQTFTIARRETNMEAAMLDGTLTANIQPEGLQVGDVIKLAMTTQRVDPVMKDHVEGTYAVWNAIPLEKAHARVSWPVGLNLVARQTDELPQPQRSTRDGWNSLELSAQKVEPLLLPRGAPFRFQIGRAGEVTDFKSWSDVAELMAPLYKQAAVLPKSGPLRDEVEKIRQSAKTDKERAQMALQLVEERIRYVALSMGLGGYVPATAETTWSRRFGDCKAKTVLLLALLHELGIEADAVLVHSSIGDALPERLPMVSYFDHVIVRAKVGGKTYWLDGTRTGDGDLDRIPVRNFEWGLPLIANARLVAIVPQQLAAPDTETRIEIDAKAGVFATVPFKVERRFVGDTARGLNMLYSGVSPAQRDQAMREYWKGRYDYVEIKSVTSAFDKARVEFRMAMAGNAILDWDDNYWLYVPGSTVAFEPNFDRADGRFHDAPFDLAYPNWEKTHVTVRLPDGFASEQNKVPQPIKETLAGVEYARDVLLDGSALSVKVNERTVTPEVAYKDAVASKTRLKALYDEDVHLRVPAGYRMSEADFAGLALRKPASATEFIWRGNIYLDAAKFDEAIADFTQAHRLDSTNKWALANRGMAHAWKRNFTEAERDLAAGETIDPGNAVVLRARGLLAEFKGDYGAAVDLFTKSLTRDPGNSFARSHRAFALTNQRKFDEALADLNVVLEQQPRNAFALAQRATAYRALGDNDKALADAGAALSVGNTSPEVRLLRANLYRDLGKHDLVVKEAELLIQENPTSEYALVAAGKIFSAEGRRDAALEAHDRALKIKPQAYIYVNRAQVRSPADRAGRLADLDEALKLEPDHSEALAYKASLLLRQGEHEQAIRIFDRALQGTPIDQLDLRRGRSVALYKIGKTEEAEQEFRQIRAESKEAVDFNNLCWDKATAGIFLESALDDCREALKLRPDAASYLDSLGMVLLRLGRLDEAVETYGRAIAKGRPAASFMGRAIAHARKGDLTQAQADRAEALKLYPDIERQFADYGLEVPAVTANQGK